MNYNSNGIPGPERSRTCANQPDKMWKSKSGTGHHPGQAHYANAVYTYKPRFDDGTYKEGVVSEDDKQVTFEIQTPYVIACTPHTNAKWGIYEPGGTNGLVIEGQNLAAPVFAASISTDSGKSWKPISIARGAVP